jgi:hypothetical protein
MASDRAHFDYFPAAKDRSSICLPGMLAQTQQISSSKAL